MFFSSEDSEAIRSPFKRRGGSRKRGSGYLRHFMAPHSAPHHSQGGGNHHLLRQKMPVEESPGPATQWAHLTLLKPVGLRHCRLNLRCYGVPQAPSDRQTTGALPMAQRKPPDGTTQMPPLFLEYCDLRIPAPGDLGVSLLCPRKPHRS